VITATIVGNNGQSLLVTDEGAIQAVVHPHPPLYETAYPNLWSQFATTSGSPGGVRDMIVDGSTTPIDFYIAAREDITIWVNRFNVRISDPGARLDRFGALAALTNGLDFFYETGDLGRVVIGERITTNLEFVRLSGGKPSFGTGADAFLADIAGGTGEDTYLPTIDINEIFGAQWGLRLRVGSNDRAGFTVRDNLAGLSVFNIFGTGISMNGD